jgi:hypothetical protein
LSEDHRRKTVIILGSGSLPFMAHPLLDEVWASAQAKFIAFASDQVEQRGAVQFNYVLQIHYGPQAALHSRADDLV